MRRLPTFSFKEFVLLLWYPAKVLAVCIQEFCVGRCVGESRRCRLRAFKEFFLRHICIQGILFASYLHSRNSFSVIPVFEECDILQQLPVFEDFFFFFFFFDGISCIRLDLKSTNFTLSEGPAVWVFGFSTVQSVVDQPWQSQTAGTVLSTTPTCIVRTLHAELLLLLLTLAVRSVKQVATVQSCHTTVVR